MDHFFDLVNGKMQSLDLSTKPSHIFNVDETFASRTSTEKVFAVIIINLSDNNYFSLIN